MSQQTETGVPVHEAYSNRVSSMQAEVRGHGDDRGASLAVAMRDATAVDPENDSEVLDRHLVLARHALQKNRSTEAERAYLLHVHELRNQSSAPEINDIAFLLKRRQWEAIHSWASRVNSASSEVRITSVMAALSRDCFDTSSIASKEKPDADSIDVIFLLRVHALLINGWTEWNALPESTGVSSSTIQLADSLKSVYARGGEDELELAVRICETLPAGKEGLRWVAALVLGWAALIGDPFRNRPELTVRIREMVVAPQVGSLYETPWSSGMRECIEEHLRVPELSKLMDAGEIASQSSEEAVPTRDPGDTCEPVVIQVLRLTKATRAALNSPTAVDLTGELESTLFANLRQIRRESSSTLLLRIHLVLTCLRYGRATDARAELSAFATGAGHSRSEWPYQAQLVTTLLAELIEAPWPLETVGLAPEFDEVASGCGYWASAARILLSAEARAGDYPNSSDMAEFEPTHPVRVVGAAIQIGSAEAESREFVAVAGRLTDAMLTWGYENYESVFSLRCSQARALLQLGRIRHAIRVSRYAADSVNSLMPDSKRLLGDLRLLQGRALLAGAYYSEANGVLESLEADPRSHAEHQLLSGICKFALGDYQMAIVCFTSAVQEATDSGVGSGFGAVPHVAMRWLGRASACLKTTNSRESL